MSEYPHDEFDDVPEDGARQGAHRGHNPRAREGSTRQFRAVLVSGVLALVLGTIGWETSKRRVTARVEADRPKQSTTSTHHDDSAEEDP